MVTSATYRQSSRPNDPGLAAEVAAPSDRYWIAVYTMIIALADGKKDWREVEFLSSLEKTFGLTDNQMDVALQTASQFPAVELGGVAPD